MTTFDFGNGPVPAHRHPNGGGWVADTAYVDDTAYVGSNAQVFDNAAVYDNATIFDNARIFDRAKVSDDARVHGDVRVFGNARICDNLRIRRGEYAATPITITRSDGHKFPLQSDGSILAGCRDFTPEEADAHWGNPEHRLHHESMAIVNALRSIAAARLKSTEGAS